MHHLKALCYSSHMTNPESITEILLSDDTRWMVITPDSEGAIARELGDEFRQAYEDQD